MISSLFGDVAMASGSPPIPRRSGHKVENPFLSNDRVHIPELTSDAWEIAPDVPGNGIHGTPARSDGRSPSDKKSLDSNVYSPGWTPASSGWSRLSVGERETKQAEAEAYFHDRERRGLLTPAQSPSDFMRRGPLYDPDDSSSSSGGPSPFLLSMGEDPSVVGR